MEPRSCGAATRPPRSRSCCTFQHAGARWSAGCPPSIGCVQEGDQLKALSFHGLGLAHLLPSPAARLRVEVLTKPHRPMSLGTPHGARHPQTRPQKRPARQRPARRNKLTPPHPLVGQYAVEEHFFPRTSTPMHASRASPHHASHSCRLAHTRKLTHATSQRRRRPAPPLWCFRLCPTSVRRYYTTSAAGVSQQAPRGDRLQTQLADVPGLRASHATCLCRRRGRLWYETPRLRRCRVG